MTTQLHCKIVEYLLCRSKNGDTTAAKILKELVGPIHDPSGCVTSPGGCVSVPNGPSVSEQLQAELEPIPVATPEVTATYPGKYHVG